jgi:hypothetical protein
VSTNTNNNINETTQDKTKLKKREKRKIDQLRLFALKHELLKISVRLQTTFA